MLKNILLVDDDVASRRLTDIALRDANIFCSVTNAKDGKEALNKLKECSEPPEVILLDINMPVMDGLQFLDEYKNLPGNTGYTKIYMLTTSLREKDYITASASGIVKDYFEKPLTEDHIEQICRENEMKSKVIN